MKFAPNSNIFVLFISVEIKATYCHKYQKLWKLSILYELSNFFNIINFSNIIIFIDLLPVPFNTSEKRDQNYKKITWSFDNFVKLFQYWSNFKVLTTWMASMNSEWLKLLSKEMHTLLICNFLSILTFCKWGQLIN